MRTQFLVPALAKDLTVPNSCSAPSIFTQCRGSMASRAITWTFFCMRFGSLPCINASAVAAAGAHDAGGGGGGQELDGGENAKWIK